jgi:hypothetical protein
MRFLFAEACILMLGNSAIAGQATCADYTQAKGKGRSLFNGSVKRTVKGRAACPPPRTERTSCKRSRSSFW